MDLALDGSIQFQWNRISNEWLSTFQVHRGSGTVAIPAIGLPSEPGGLIGARQVSAAGRLNAQGLILEDIRIETGSTEQAGPILNAEFSALSGDQGAEIAVRLESPQVSRGDLFFLWPSTVAPQTRQQVANYIETAAFTNLVFAGSYRINPGQEAGQQSTFTRTYQEVRADFDQATVTLTPSLPKFESALGRLDLVNDGLNIRLDTANFGPAAMRDGFTEINFADPKWLQIRVGGDVGGHSAPL